MAEYILNAVAWMTRRTRFFVGLTESEIGYEELSSFHRLRCGYHADLDPWLSQSRR
jgi:hypothetical protein